MKKYCLFLLCAALCLCCILGTSCASDGNGNINVFLSVRMKGNGDGTVTAFAQNEFALCAAPLSVTLEIYTSDVGSIDFGDMKFVDSVSSDDLAAPDIIMLTFSVESESYYSARVLYSIGGESGELRSDVILYGVDGKRK